MNSSLRSKAVKRLTKVPHETLVASLLNLAEQSREAMLLVEELITTSDEALASFKRKLSGLKRRTRFYHRSEARILAAELEGLLRLLDSEDLPTHKVLSAVVSFFQTDSKIMEMADDSYGELGNVFRFDATKRLVGAASALDDQETLQAIFKKLYAENDYGVRDKIVDHASSFLTIESLRKLHQHYSALSSEGTSYNHSQARILKESLVVQLKDPELYEAELLEVSEQYYHVKLPDLAKVYLAANRVQDLAERLEEWLPLIPALLKHSLEEIAQEVYSTNKDQEKLLQILTEKLFSEASQVAYEKLSVLLSKSKLSSLMEKFRTSALADPILRLSHVRFFLEHNEADTAASLVKEHSNSLNGDDYYTLPTLAQSFVEADHPFAATLIFRSLITSILNRGATKAYGHAIRYLEILHSIFSSIEDWEIHQHHFSFLQDLHQLHHRKSSFWRKVHENIKEHITR